MSIEFSSNIAMLRRDKHISQKEAAQALGVSQALLSHYENGIRECSLDFVKKAAAYYNVTTDFLLNGNQSGTDGYTENIMQTSPADFSVTPQTVTRGIGAILCMQSTNETASTLFTEYFALCLRKLTALSENNRKENGIIDLALSECTNAIFNNVTIDTDLVFKVPAVQTVSEYTDTLLQKCISNAEKYII